MAAKSGIAQPLSSHAAFQADQSGTTPARSRLAALRINGKPLPSVEAPSTSDNMVRQGKQLIHDLGCRSCHVVAAKQTELKTQFPSLISGSEKQTDWKKSCVRDRPASNGKPFQPAFGQVAHEAIKAFVGSIPKNAAQPAVADHGHRLLVTRNCTACHPRGLRQGLAAMAGKIATTDAELRGQAPSLVPPNLKCTGRSAA